MKKYTDTFLSKIKRLCGIVLIQCLWVVPLLIGLWYIQDHLRDWTNTYFGLGKARHMADILTNRLEKAGSPVLWNPSTIANYLKIHFFTLTATVRFNSLLLISGLVVKIGSFLIVILKYLSLFYALIRVRRAYRIQTQTKSVANSVCQALMPEITALRQEVQDLRLLLEKQSPKAQNSKE